MIETNNHLAVGLTDPIRPEYLADAQATLDFFVDNPGFDLMAGLHGITLPGADDREARMAAITHMSDNFWDLRGMQGGVERQGIKMEDIKWSDMPGLADVMTKGSEAWNTVFAAAQHMQMFGDNTLPSDLRYSGARYVLGAAAGSMLPRVQLALGHTIVTPKAGLELPPPQQSGQHPALQDHTGVIIGLGTHRPVNPKNGELDIAHTYAPGAKVESDLVVGAFRRELTGRSYTEKTYPLKDIGYEYAEGTQPTLTEISVNKGSTLILALHAPQPAVTERDRAQTPHTFAMMSTVLRDIVQLQPGMDIIGASNSIYQFQRVAGVNAFSRLGLRNHFVSFGHETAGTGRQAAQFLPEFRSLEIQLRFLAQAVAASK